MKLAQFNNSLSDTLIFTFSIKIVSLKSFLRQQSAATLHFQQFYSKNIIVTLLPLDGGRGLGSHVEDDTVNLGHRVGDARRDVGQDIVGQARPVGRHRILGRHGAQRDRVTIGTAITLNTHGTNVGKQDDRTLPDLLIQAGSRELLASNQVSSAQDIQALTRDLVILGPLSRCTSYQHSQHTSILSRSWEANSPSALSRNC